MKNIKFSDLYPYLIVILIFPIYLYQLNFHSLWFDEHLTVNAISQQNLGALIQTIYRYESIPPLFFMIEYFFVRIFGLSEFTVRLIPMTFGLISGVLYYTLFKKTSNNFTALMSMIAFVTSSFLIVYSTEARVYSILIALSLTILINVIAYVNNNSWKQIFILSLLYIISLNIHYYSLLMVSAISFTLLFIDKKRIENIKKHLFLGFSIIISFISVLPHFINQIAIQTNGAKASLIGKAHLAIFYIPIKILLGTSIEKLHSLSTITGLDFVLIVIATLLIIITVIYQLIQINKHGFSSISQGAKVIILFMLISYFLHILIGFKLPSLHPRYLSYSIVLLSGFIFNVFHKKRTIQIGLLFLIVCINLFGIFKNLHSTDVYYRRPWKLITYAIEDIDVDNNLPVISDRMGILALPYYLNRNSRLYEYSGGPRLNYSESIINRGKEKFNNKDIALVDFKDKANSNVSVINFMKEQKKGLMVYKEEKPPFDLEFVKEFKSEFSFSIIKKINSYQGTIYLIKWSII